jgi:hypothetical protein
MVLTANFFLDLALSDQTYESFNNRDEQMEVALNMFNPESPMILPS